MKRFWIHYCDKCGVAFKPNGTNWCDEHRMAIAKEHLELQEFRNFCDAHKTEIKAMMKAEDDKRKAAVQSHYSQSMNSFGQQQAAYGSSYGAAPSAFGNIFGY